ncbi:hypothetical protein JCM13210_03260 [Thermaerobacter litoralis]
MGRKALVVALVLLVLVGMLGHLVVSVERVRQVDLSIRQSLVGF